MNTIAIDCGSSFIKAALFDDGGEIVKDIQSRAPLVNRNELDGTEQIDGLIALVRNILSELLSYVDDERVRLSVSNEMHGFLLATADGAPVTDYISWQKEYGRLPIDGVTPIEIISEHRQEIMTTGMPLRGGLPSVNLLYLNKILDLRAEIYFYTLGDYILRMLSGVRPSCHPTNAAATGLFDLTTNDWNQKLLGLVANDRIIFPTIGEEPIEFKIDGVLITALPAIGDQQAALSGAGLERDDQLSFNMGTGGQVSRLVSTLEFSDRYQTRPFLDGRFIKTIPHIPCGRALNVYLRFFRDALKIFDVTRSDDEIWRALSTAAATSDGSDLKCDLSFFDNAASDHRVGSIENIGEYSLTVGGLMRAVFDRLSDNFNRAAEVLIDEHRPITKIVFSGGVARRIKAVRDRILESHAPITHTVASNETLKGLYLYSMKGGS